METHQHFYSLFFVPQLPTREAGAEGGVGGRHSDRGVGVVTGGAEGGVGGRQYSDRGVGVGAGGAEGG